MPGNFILTHQHFRINKRNKYLRFTRKFRPAITGQTAARITFLLKTIKTFKEPIQRQLLYKIFKIKPRIDVKSFIHPSGAHKKT